MTELLLTPKQISAWKRRAPLPHALDSTAQLVDATLHDDPQRASLLAIRNAYCAAFNRYALKLFFPALSFRPLHARSLTRLMDVFPLSTKPRSPQKRKPL